LRAAPTGELDPCDHLCACPDKRRIPAASRDGGRDERLEERCLEPVVNGVAANPDLELRADREHDRKQAVGRPRIGLQTAQAHEPLVHGLTVNGEGSGVISRPADPRAPKDQPVGGRKIVRRADDDGRAAT
jgi:hypothetical protein